MFKNPDPADLLRIAGEAFVTDIMPHVPAENRYTAAMIANAMAIAARQLSATETAQQDRLLSRVYGENTIKTWVDLADDLRSGAVSANTHPSLLEDMMHHVRAELAISNPKFVEQDRTGTAQEGWLRSHSRP